MSVFALVVKNVASGKARPVDEALRRKITSLQCSSMDAASRIVTVATAPAFLITCSLAVAFGFRGRGVHVWLPIAASPLVAMTAGRCFTEILPQQYAPASKDGECEPCFPSGHTTGATAETLTIACVLQRIGAINMPAAMAISLVPIVGGFNRLYRDRHWASDIVAGLSAGTAIATVLTSIEKTSRL